MPNVKKLRDLPVVTEQRATVKKDRERHGTFSKKKFEQLNTVQKDQLLKLVAIRLGLVSDSLDVEETPPVTPPKTK